MRDDLHCFPEVVAATFALNNMLVDLACGDVLVAGESDVEVAFVVSEVEVDFAAVVEDVDLAVSYSSVSFFLVVIFLYIFFFHSIEEFIHRVGYELDRSKYLYTSATHATSVKIRAENIRHKAGIDIQVGINLNTRHGEAQCLQQKTAARGNNTLANTGDNTCSQSVFRNAKKRKEKEQEKKNPPPETRMYFIVAIYQTNRQ